MDAATAAAIAALVVSILAMAIAFAQALQQYLITGQLIRICDSVVYGRMPGKGRRIWEFAQFRFRVVYSVPQMCLKPSLWTDNMSELSLYREAHSSVPDLRHDIKRSSCTFKKLVHGQFISQTKSVYSAVPGEASWVSFARVAQHASSNDLFYTLIEDDADRCPSDLPVVPMQVSLRDIAVLALMAGMRCTDASFEQKSLCMDGTTGSITTSKHPILGSVIHFNARVRSDMQPPGLRIGHGSINKAVVSRMSDTLIVAGRRFSIKERAYYEEYEHYHWKTLSSDTSIAKAPSVYCLRTQGSTSRRRKKHDGMNQDSPPSNCSGSDSGETRRHSAEQDMIQEKVSVRRGGSDGDWAWTLETSESALSVDTMPSLSHQQEQNNCRAVHRPESWLQHLRLRVQKLLPRSRDRMKPRQDQSFPLDLEGLDRGNGATDGIRSMNPNHLRWRSPEKPLAKNGAYRKGPTHLDGASLQNYINYRKSMPPGSPTHGKLLLPWTGESQKSRAIHAKRSFESLPDNDEWCEKIKLERSMSYLSQWQEILHTRQQSRVKRALEDDWDARDTISFKSSSRSFASRIPSRRSSVRSRRPFSRASMARTLSLSPERQGLEKKEPLQRGTETRERGRARYRSPVSVETRTSAHSPQNLSNIVPGTKVIYGNLPVSVPGDQGETKQQEQQRAGEPEYNELKPKPHVGFRDSVEYIDSPKSSSDSESDQLEPSRRYQEEKYKDQDADALEQGAKQIERRRDDTAIYRNADRAFDQASSGVDQQAHGEEEAVQERFNTDIKMDSFLNIKRGILKTPTEKFPGETNEVREGVAPFQQPDQEDEIPRAARWTKIDRRMVNPEALEEAGERFEERRDAVIVLRVLTRREIQHFAERTSDLREIRSQRNKSPLMERLRDGTSPEIDEAQLRTSELSDVTENDVLADSRLSESPSRMSEEAQEPYPHRKNKSDGKIIPPSLHEFTSRSDDFRYGRVSSTSTLRAERNPDRYRQKSTRRNSSETEEIYREPTDDFDFTKPTFWGSPIPAEFSLDSDESSIARSSTGSTSEKDDRVKGSLNWFWICQADVLPGYVATSWQSYFSESVCFGAIVTMLEVLQYFTDDSTLKYVGQQLTYKDWILEGKSTYPSFAINAMGGTIVSGKYQRAKFNCLATRIPPIELLHSYVDQVDRNLDFKNGSLKIIETLGEIMGLDSWLSFCGRLPEICNGRNNLLRRMPALIQKLMTDFEYEFQNLDRTATEGGLQVIKEMSELLMLELEDLNLSSAEQLFAIVALLRTAKAALSVLRGPSTAKLTDILREEVRVYIV